MAYPLGACPGEFSGRGPHRTERDALQGLDWTWKGTCPRIVRDHRDGYVYLFSAACPKPGPQSGMHAQEPTPQR